MSQYSILRVTYVYFLICRATDIFTIFCEDIIKMIAALLIMILIIVITMIMWIHLYKTTFELILDGKTFGITNAYGLDSQRSMISMDFKLKPLPGDVRSLVGLFCIGFREPTLPRSKKYYMSMNKSLLQMRMFVQEPPREKTFQHDLDVDFFDDEWHHMSVIIDVTAQMIVVKFDDNDAITIVDDTGRYPIGTADKVYIGGIVDGYLAIGHIKNVKFGNILKTFKYNINTTTQTFFVNLRHSCNIC
jgi:hypothetical protein